MVNDEQMFGLVYWDGSNYLPFNVPLASEHKIFDVLETPLGLVISGDFESNGNIKLFNGTSWESLGDGLNDRVLDKIWHNETLYACGEFDGSGDTSIDHVALYGFSKGAGSTDFTPKVNSSISCEAEPSNSNFPTTGERHICFNAVTNPYSVIIGVAGSNGSLTAGYTIEIDVES